MINLTETRIAWLKHLRDHGPTRSMARGTTVFGLRRAGLVRFERDSAGNMTDRDEITPEGIAALSRLVGE